MREIDSAHRKILKIFSGGQKMKKIASKLVSFNPNKIIFRGFLTPEKFFRIFRCAQSISRIKLPLEKSFLQKLKKNFFSKVLLQSLPPPPFKQIAFSDVD